MKQLAAFVQGRIAVTLKISQSLAAAAVQANRSLHAFSSGKAMRAPFGLFIMTVVVVVATWWRIGAPVTMPQVPLGPGGKIPCVSYAPFRDNQNPLRPNEHVEAWQIEDDLTRLAAVTGCVRTYSIEHGLDQIPGIAARHGLKVIHGLWLSSNRDKNRIQIDTTIALARRYPEVISAVVVGNEVLLRGELSAAELGAIMREIKAAVPMPVTYADVWEFWLRNPDLATIADFITIHILPYWEDDPVPARRAAAHVAAIRAQVAAAFPGKEILIGEVGWPSAGRMRQGALPSRSNQARVLQEVMGQAARMGYRINLIEAFDQPWKRWLEGTVGGHWGLLTARDRAPKFAWGAPVSDHPGWRLLAGCGILLAGLVFATAGLSASSAGGLTLPVWLGVTANALAAGILAGRIVEAVGLESLGIGGWIRGLALAAVGLAGPVIGAAALARGVPLPAFGLLLDRQSVRPSDRLVLANGILLIAATVLAVQTALGFVFDPRYRDFPFAALTTATVPLFVQVLMTVRKGRRGLSETIAAATLALAAVFIVPSEGFANWQAVWFGAVLLLLALTLALVRDARDRV